MKQPSSRPHPPLPDDACPRCGALMQAEVGPVPTIVQGEDVVVPGVSHLRCPSCGEIVLLYEGAKDLQERGIALFRQSHGLLSADEIRTLRAQLGVSQGQLATLLRLGQNTVSRWESGRNVQSAAMDLLLKLLRDVPGTLDYLERHAA